jgi:signal transduction histidine kinase
MKKVALLVMLSALLVNLANAQNGNGERPAVVRIPDKPSQKETEPDIKARTQLLKRLVDDGVIHFTKNKFEVACRDFAHGAQWHIGNIFIFVLDKHANIYVHGDDTALIWQSMSNVKGPAGEPIINQMLDVGKQGGWVNFSWQGGFQSTYVRYVEKDGEGYIVGSGFYPESQEYSTIRIVNDVIGTWQRIGKDRTFALVNYPFGPFVEGGIYSMVFDLEGNCWAHGENAGMIGQNLLETKDDNGKFLVKELIDVAKSPAGRGWVDYIWKHEPKKSYVQRFVDPKTKIPYLVSAGYWPNIDQDDVRVFVERAIKHLQNVGAKTAFADFSNPVGSFIRGPLFLEVYSLDGRVLADGENPGFVNQDFLNRRDLEGRFITKDILNVATKFGKGTVTIMDRNAYKVLYVEKVTVPDGVFIFTSGYYPASKTQSVQSLVAKGTEFLRNNNNVDAFREFNNTNGEFWRGDVHLFVYTENGTRLVARETNLIWQNFYKERDQEGKSVIENLIALALAGGGWARYQSRGATRRVFVKAVEKLNKAGQIEKYIVGSGYYL